MPEQPEHKTTSKSEAAEHKAVKANTSSSSKKMSVQSYVPWIIAGIMTLVAIFLAAALVSTRLNRDRLTPSFDRGTGMMGNNQRGTMFDGNGFGMRRAGGMNGTVTAVSSSSLTVKDSTGASRTYVVNNTTSVRKADGTVGAIGDVTNGATVLVRASGQVSEQIAYTVTLR